MTAVQHGYRLLLEFFYKMLATTGKDCYTSLDDLYKASSYISKCLYVENFNFDKIDYKYPVQLQYNSPKGTTMIGFSPRKMKRRIFTKSYVKLN